jgi:hypothetical protein
MRKIARKALISGRFGDQIRDVAQPEHAKVLGLDISPTLLATAEDEFE